MNKNFNNIQTPISESLMSAVDTLNQTQFIDFSNGNQHAIQMINFPILTQFKIQGNRLSLPSGWSKNLMGRLGSDVPIIIRDSYNIITKKIKSYLENREVTDQLVTGNPGIGKSIYLIFLFYSFLKEERDIILHSCHNDQILYFKYNYPSYTGYSIPYGDKCKQNLENLQINYENTLYLIDCIPYEKQLPIKCSKIMVSSNREICNEFLKSLSMYNQTLWMGPWTKSEVNQLKECYNLDLSTTEKLFRYWGGIPVYLMDPNSIFELENAITECKLSDIINFLGQSSAQDQQSHMILHATPGPSFKIATVDFGSEYIKKKVLKKFLYYHMNDVLKEMNVKKFLHSHLGGQFFEQISHHVLTSPNSIKYKFLFPPDTILELDDGISKKICKTNVQGDFIFTNLANSGSFIVSNPSYNISKYFQTKSISTRTSEITGNINDFSQDKELTTTIIKTLNFSNLSQVKDGYYSIPISKSLCSFDSIVRTNENSFVFLTTVFNTHQINQEKYNELVNNSNFKNLNLFFVVPGDIFESFSYQMQYHHKNVKQFCLYMKLKNN